MTPRASARCRAPPSVPPSHSLRHANSLTSPWFVLLVPVGDGAREGTPVRLCAAIAPENGRGVATTAANCVVSSSVPEPAQHSVRETWTTNFFALSHLPSCETSARRGSARLCLDTRRWCQVPANRAPRPLQLARLCRCPSPPAQPGPSGGHRPVSSGQRELAGARAAPTTLTGSALSRDSGVVVCSGQGGQGLSRRGWP